MEGLRGGLFPTAAGIMVPLSGARGRRSADHALVLLYALAEDIQRLYEGIRFDWCRYRERRVELSADGPYGRPRVMLVRKRTHRTQWDKRKIKGLPDPQFAKLLMAARLRWPDEALFWRNLVLLLVLRYAGARRSEAPTVDCLDRIEQRIYLVTKGHRGGDKLPVVLLPIVRDAAWKYITEHRRTSATRCL